MRYLFLWKFFGTWRNCWRCFALLMAKDWRYNGLVIWAKVTAQTRTRYSKFKDLLHRNQSCHVTLTYLSLILKHIQECLDSLAWNSMHSLSKTGSTSKGSLGLCRHMVGLLTCPNCEEIRCFCLLISSRLPSSNIGLDFPHLVYRACHASFIWKLPPWSRLACGNGVWI